MSRNVVSKKRVYISRDYQEFRREHLAIEKLIQDLGMEVSALGTWGGMASEWVVLHENLVRESDIFIGIYGSANGGMVPDHIHPSSVNDMPYLEWEYRMAEEEGMPVLAFVQDVKFRDKWLTELLQRIITRKGAYKFRGQRDLVDAIRTKLLGLSEGAKLSKAKVEEATLDDASKASPKVIISYAWEDEDHKEWVSQLGTRLRKDGVDIILDQWSTKLGDQLPYFMEKSVRESDFVIFICTPDYQKKADDRIGGVGYEGHIITSEIYESNNQGKFIPVLRRGDWNSAVPTWAKGKKGVDLRGDPYSEQLYEELLRYLHGLISDPPPLGPIPGDERFKSTFW